jgi:hypothetical protein
MAETEFQAGQAKMVAAKPRTLLRKTRMAISLRLATSNFLWRTGVTLELIFTALMKPKNARPINAGN